MNVLGSDEVSDIWFVLGMAYDDKRDDKAIEAFTNALKVQKDYVKALFQRGQTYYRKGDTINARRDLEGFLATDKPPLEFARQQARKMLLDLGRP